MHDGLWKLQTRPHKILKGLIIGNKANAYKLEGATLLNRNHLTYKPARLVSAHHREKWLQKDCFYSAEALAPIE